MTVLTAGHVVTPRGVLAPGWLEVAGATIAAVGAGSPPSPARDLGPGWLLPGFIDQHVHGGGGKSFQSGRVEDASDVLAFHRRHGTTTALASLVTAPVPELTAAVASLGELVDDGLLAGVHLEGPFLASSFCGAHDPSLLRAPDSSTLRALLSVRPGTVRMVTLAPELPGGREAVPRIVDAGAVAAIGHTAATFADVRAALSSGATVGTHLFNAMPPLHHRAPGPVAALLDDPSAVVELIVDGTHLHPAVVRQVVSAAGPERVALVTDAIAAAGCPDGQFILGGLPVTVTAGTARLTDGGAIAGSTATMASVVRRAIRDVGLPVAAVAAMAATTPAAALGLSDRGALSAGLRADLVVLDEQHQLTRVMAAGRWIDDSTDQDRSAAWASG